MARNSYTREVNKARASQITQQEAHLARLGKELRGNATEAPQGDLNDPKEPRRRRRKETLRRKPKPGDRE